MEDLFDPQARLDREGAVDFEEEVIGQQERPAPGKMSSTVSIPQGPREAELDHGGDGAGASSPHRLVDKAQTGPGQKLPSHVRAEFEQAMGGVDLSGVNIHTGAQSQAASKSVHAHAYALGQDIHFAEGKYDPHSAEGKHLLAHELAHTVQQGAGAGALQTKLETSSAGDSHEQEADRFASSMTSGGTPTSITPGSADAGVVHRLKTGEGGAGATYQPPVLKELSDQQLVASYDDARAMIVDLDDRRKELERLGEEISRRNTANAVFDDEAVARMKDVFVKNARKGMGAKDCISILIAGQKALHGPDPKGMRNNVSDTMGALQDQGLAEAENRVDYVDKNGRPSGVRRPVKMVGSAFDKIISLTRGDRGWVVFGLGILAGNHAVTVTVDNRKPGKPKLYWSDQWQDLGGFKRMHKSDIDQHLTHYTVAWWDQKVAERGVKFPTATQLWRIRLAPELKVKDEELALNDDADETSDRLTLAANDGALSDEATNAVLGGGSSVVALREDGSGQTPEGVNVTQPGDAAEAQADAAADRATGRKAIKEDLESLMNQWGGWNADEAGILARIRSATDAELSAVLWDKALMKKLGACLSHAEMKSMLDMLDAGLFVKIRLAIDGFGTDEAYLFELVRGATEHQVRALVGGKDWRDIIDDLSGSELAEFRAIVINKLLEGGSALSIAMVLADVEADALSAALMATGASATRQKEILDELIRIGGNEGVQMAAFEAYWDVDLTVGISDEEKEARKEGGFWVKVKHILGIEAQLTPLSWSMPLLVQIHKELLLLPEGDSRASFTELKLEDGGGGYMSSDGTFGIGQGAEGTSSFYGSGVSLMVSAPAGLKHLATDGKPSDFTAGDTITITDPDGGSERVVVNAVSSIGVTVRTPLTRNYASGSTLVLAGQEAFAGRKVGWVEAVVRHEIGHAVDNVLGGATGFYDLGAWQIGTSIDEWIAKMSNPWQTKDGTTLTAEEQEAIKDRIDELVDSVAGADMRDGLDEDHPVRKYWRQGVPVLEAAKPCISAGKFFCFSPSSLFKDGATVFSINPYYGKYQSHSIDLITQKTREYQTFSKQEFFAEIYTVFYETKDAPGSLVPVGAWRDWIQSNVHDRGLSPDDATEKGIAGVQPGPGEG